MTHCHHEWPMGSWPCCLSASPNGTGVIQDEYRTEETDTWCLVDYIYYPILPDTHLEICQGFLFLGHIANRRTNPSKQIPVTSHCLEKSPCKSSKHLHDQSCPWVHSDDFSRWVSLQSCDITLWQWEAHVSIALGKLSILSYSNRFRGVVHCHRYTPKTWRMAHILRLPCANIMPVANVQYSTVCSRYWLKKVLCI